MALSDNHFQPVAGMLKTAVRSFPAKRSAARLGVTIRGGLRAQVMALAVMRRYQIVPARPPAQEAVLRRQLYRQTWLQALHLHLAPRLELTALSVAPMSAPDVRLEGRQADAPLPASDPRRPIDLPAVRVFRQTVAAQPLVERLHTRSQRASAFDPRPNEPALARAFPAAPANRPASAQVTRGSTPWLLLRQIPHPAPPVTQGQPPATPGASPEPAALPRIGANTQPPDLHLDQLPTHEINRLAERVIQTIDRRILAQRERLGRV
jgi:hypothetical protein